MSVSPEDYRKCLEAVELEDIRLADISAQAKSLSEIELSPKGGGLQAQVGLETEHQVDQVTRNLTVRVTAKVTGMRVGDAEGDEGVAVLDIRATFALVYSFDPDFEVGGTVIEQFIRRNVPINAWPYIREIVADLTLRMGYPKLVLPTLKLLR